MFTTAFLSIRLADGCLGCFQALAYCKQCFDEHWGTHVSLNSGFLGVYAQQWDCWVVWQFFFQFLRHLLMETLFSMVAVVVCIPTHWCVFYSFSVQYLTKVCSLVFGKKIHQKHEDNDMFGLLIRIQMPNLRFSTILNLWRQQWQPTPVLLENPMGRGVWQAVVHGVTQSQTRLK